MALTTKPHTATKLDLRKQYNSLYSPSAKDPVLVDVPELLFIKLDGALKRGERPSDSDAFREAIAAMYGVAYGLKFMSKLREEDPIDFTVMALEGLWSAGSGDFSFGTDEPWEFTLLMIQPDHITHQMFEQIVADTNEKHPNARLEDIRLERWREGLSVQVMHIGPYSDEQRSFEKIYRFVEANGYQLVGRHHEIYLGDPRRARPENLKTILRHPVSAT